jgi:hypothetical protein
MKIHALSIVVLFAIVLGGCYSMDVGTNTALQNSELKEGVDKPIEHVLISNYGWYLFNCIPLVCGNATRGESFPWKFFTDQVNPILLHDRMMEYANSKNANVKNIVFTRDERVFFEVPGTEIPCPLPFLVCYHEIQLSGVLVKPGKPTKSGDNGKDGSK